MSYRELRNFTEIMRTLGYPRLISMENFRTPNFPLVAELLIWLVNRIDQTAILNYDITVEEERVLLIRTTAQILALKAGVKINTKKLYQADGHAVQELLKVAQLLYNSLKSNNDETLPNFESDFEIIDVVATRQILTEITDKGAALFDLLTKEPELREMRHAKASKAVEVAQVENGVKHAITDTEIETKKTQQLIDNVANTETALESKIEKVKSDIDRQGKRLQSLKKMRPAYMEEFEKLEGELKALYAEYVSKSRNLAYLESVLDQLDKTDRMQWEVRQETTRNLLKDMRIDETLIQEEIEDLPKTALKGKVRVSAAKGPRKNFGSMTGQIDESENDSLNDSDDDLLIDDDLSEGDDDQKSFKDSEDDF